MSYPRILQRLFANAGAGPKLLPEIIPFGTAAGTACQGNDARLSNARTPTAHKDTHKTGGADVLTPADIGAAANTLTISAGNGLTGGGNLTGNVTLAAKLLDSVASTDTTSAGTANAVKVAYDTAVNALNIASSAQTVAGAKAPMPQQAAGVGQIIQFTTSNAPLILSAGGTWFVFFISFNVIGGSQNGGARVGVFPGGAVIYSIDNVAHNYCGFVWRLY